MGITFHMYMRVYTVGNTRMCCINIMNHNVFQEQGKCHKSRRGGDIEVPSRVDGKRRNLARVSDFVS